MATCDGSFVDEQGKTTMVVFQPLPHASCSCRSALGLLPCPRTGGGRLASRVQLPGRAVEPNHLITQSLNHSGGRVGRFPFPLPNAEGGTHPASVEVCTWHPSGSPSLVTGLVGCHWRSSSPPRRRPLRHAFWYLLANWAGRRRSPVSIASTASVAAGPSKTPELTISSRSQRVP